MCLYESNEGLPQMTKLLCLNMNVPTSLRLLNVVEFAMITTILLKCVKVIYRKFVKNKLTAPATFVDARESRQTVRECACAGECDHIVVNVSLDNSGLGWLTLCQE